MRRRARVAAMPRFDRPEDAVGHLREALHGKARAVVLVVFDENGMDDAVLCGDVRRSDVLWAGERLRRSAMED